MRLNRLYGNILSLLDVDVQVDAITALAQYYDPPLRCFTFPDFQLAPTLEEYGRMLNLPLTDKSKPYIYKGHMCSIAKIANVLKVDVRIIAGKMGDKGKETKGLPRKYLEEHMHYLAENQEWDAFIDVLALTIYGLILFPFTEDVVDHAAIDVFLSLKSNGENPVSAILAETYGSLNICHEKKGRRILCCLPMLYVWFSGHIFKGASDKDPMTNCPIAYYKSLHLETRSSREWVQVLTNLTDSEIRWRTYWWEEDYLVYRCGDFPNVPLMGPRECINYNPALVLRQLARPMKGPPPETALASFWIRYKDDGITPLLSKVREAWKKVVWKGDELGLKSINMNQEYYRWVKNRAEEVKMPFVKPVISQTPSTLKEESEFALLESKKMEEMKKVLGDLQKEKLQFEKRLSNLTTVCGKLEQENSELKRKDLIQSANQVKKLKTDKLQLQKEVKAAKDHMKVMQDSFHDKGKELEDLRFENEQLKRNIVNMNAAQEEANKVITGLRVQLGALITTHQSASRGEREIRQQLEAQISKLQLQVEDWKEEFCCQTDNVLEWKDRFKKLAWMANTAIEIIPERLRLADAVTNPLSTPSEVKEFIELCKEMVQQMKELATNKD